MREADEKVTAEHKTRMDEQGKSFSTFQTMMNEQYTMSSRLVEEQRSTVMWKIEQMDLKT